METPFVKESSESRGLNEVRILQQLGVLGFRGAPRLLSYTRSDRNRMLLRIERLRGSLPDVYGTVTDNTGPMRRITIMRTIVDLTYQLFLSLVYLHDIAGIVHRDIKPLNMCLRDCDDRLLCVIDYEFARRVETENGICTDTPMCGTEVYISPELDQNTFHPVQYDDRTDVWSAGITVYEMATGLDPPSGGTIAESTTVMLRRVWRHNSLGDALANFVSQCLTLEWRTRPHARELLNHSLFDTIPERRRRALHDWFDVPMEDFRELSSTDVATTPREIGQVSAHSRAPRVCRTKPHSTLSPGELATSFACRFGRHSST